jgi:CRP-like cAMP-binding protein
MARLRVNNSFNRREILDILIASPFFSNYSSIDLDFLLKPGVSICHKRANECIHAASRTSGECYYIVSGNIKVFHYDEFGGEVVVLILKDGDLIVNDLENFSGFSHFNLECIVPAELIPLKKTALNHLYLTDPCLQRILLQAFHEHFSDCSRRLRNSQSDALIKVLTSIIYIASKYSDDPCNLDFIRVIGHGQCALISNVARETFSRKLAKLRQKKFIHADSGGQLRLCSLAMSLINKKFTF